MNDDIEKRAKERMAAIVWIAILAIVLLAIIMKYFSAKYDQSSGPGVYDNPGDIVGQVTAFLLGIPVLGGLVFFCIKYYNNLDSQNSSRGTTTAPPRTVGISPAYPELDSTDSQNTERKTPDATL